LFNHHSSVSEFAIGKALANPVSGVQPLILSNEKQVISSPKESESNARSPATGLKRNHKTRKSAWYFTGWWAKFHFRPLSPESNGDWTRITGCDHQPTNAQNMGIDPLHFHNKRRGVDSVNIGRRGTNLERQ